VSVKWPGFAFRLDETGKAKKYSTLLIEIPEPEMANKVIAEGILESESPLLCTRWERTGDPRQCYNCQEYGHMARACKNETRCGRCTGPHQSKDYGVKRSQEEKCAVCQGPHESWSRECKIRQGELHRIRQKLEDKPKWFNEPMRRFNELSGRFNELSGRVNEPPGRSNEPKGLAGQPLRFSSSAPLSTTQLSRDGFTTVPARGVRKRKALADVTGRSQDVTSAPKRVGRPRRMDAVEPGQKSIQPSQTPSSQPTPTPKQPELSQAKGQEDKEDQSMDATPAVNE